MQQFLSFAGRTEYSKILNTIFKASEDRRISLTELIDSECYNADTVKLLQVHGMIEEDGDYMVISEPHRSYYDDVLVPYHMTSVGSIVDATNEIYSLIEEYKAIKSPNSKSRYLQKIKSQLSVTVSLANSQTTNLKHNVRETYKQQETLEYKVVLLKKYKKQAEDIYELLGKCQNVINEESVFSLPEINPLRVRSVRELMNIHDWLGKILQEIVNNIDSYENTADFSKKIRKLKKLKDFYNLESGSDLFERAKERKSVFFSPLETNIRRPNETAFFENTPSEEIRKILLERSIVASPRPKAPAFQEKEYVQRKKTRPVTEDDVWKTFVGQSGDLMSHIKGNSYTSVLPVKEQLTLFCRTLGKYRSRCKRRGYRTEGKATFPLIYPR